MSGTKTISEQLARAAEQLEECAEDLLKEDFESSGLFGVAALLAETAELADSRPPSYSFRDRGGEEGFHAARESFIAYCREVAKTQVHPRLVHHGGRR